MSSTSSDHPFTVADYLLTRLHQLGCTDVFQIPGDYVKHFTQALEHSPDVRMIATSNELDAAYGADAYGRTRGLGAVSLQFGVSTYSALNAFAGAYVERSPVVIISATPGSDARRIGDMYDVLYHHSVGNLNDDQDILEKVTVAAETLSTSAGAPERIDRLLVAAITHQRPVYIACYKEVWGEPCLRPGAEKLVPAVQNSDSVQLNNALDQAWAMIKNAKNPLILAGVEILRHGLSDQLANLIKSSGIPYTTTSLGKTVLDEDSDHFIGTYSDQASIPQVLKAVAKADCIITLGAIITDDYLALVETKFPRMILCSTERTRTGYFDFADITLPGFLAGLAGRFAEDMSFPINPPLPSRPAFPEPWRENLDPKFKDQTSVLTYNRFFERTMHFLHQEKLLKATVMAYGVSCGMYVGTNAMGMARGSFISSAAWQCVGYGTGATSGAQIGSGKRCWSVVGDGDFMMMAQCVSTMVRYKVNAVIFVMNNGVYAVEQVFVDPRAFSPSSGVPFDEFDILPKWDYEALAKAFGARYQRAATVDELDEVLCALQDEKDLPTIVNVVIPKNNLPLQMARIAAE